MADDLLEDAYQETRNKWHVDHMMQKLFWYDNIPTDKEIVELVKRIRELQGKENIQ